MSVPNGADRLCHHVVDLLEDHQHGHQRDDHREGDGGVHDRAIGWELIGGEPFAYFVDDPATAAFPDDGRCWPALNIVAIVLVPTSIGTATR